MTIKAWALRDPSRQALLATVGIAPLLAVIAHELSTRGTLDYTLPQAVGLALVLLAYEICFGWMNLGLLLVTRDFVLFLTKSAEAFVTGLGLVSLAFLAVPGVSIGTSGAAMMGLGSVGLLVAARAVVPLLARPRTISDGVLVVGREDLARKLCANFPTAATAENVEPAELRALVATQGIRRILIAEPDVEARRNVAAALLECRMMGVEVEDAVEVYERLHGKLWLEALDPETLVFNPDGFRITRAYRFLKRALDVVCALVLLVLSAPVVLLAALLIKLESRGPVLFRQERVGQFGRTFVLCKLRSMRQDAEDKTGPTWARENDDRVTRIGNFLRKSHIDEIPQVLNVLKGDLAFVGPRPERPCFVEMLRTQVPFYDLRQFVKPGVTGWAQVRHPYAASVQDSYEKLQYDLFYARHASLGLDIEIIARTALVVLTGKGR